MYRKYIKRILDLIFSIIFLIILSPLFIITGILTFISLGKPIIFKQDREGLNKEKFVIYKFRTMNFNEKEKREKRMTKISSLLDTLKLNELPQLINVIKGEMSLVGPRPFIYNEVLPIYPEKERYMVKPGMTGLAQMKGGRRISHEKKLEYDVIYEKNLSFLLDLKIILLTPIRIIKDKLNI